MPTLADLEGAEQEVNLALEAYRQKLKSLIALAKSVLAATPADGAVTSNDPNDPHKGHG
ncbi:MAG TPA: hypothetical protein VE779_11140 [Candidatus Angelobacter sp.]|jgi:hypothetical protein|nr:hypothetical protein [Candidatus Angelobacter sp.]